MTEAENERAEIVGRARNMLREKLLQDPDEGVRAIAMLTDPPEDRVQRIADAIEALAHKDAGNG